MTAGVTLNDPGWAPLLSARVHSQDPVCVHLPQNCLNPQSRTDILPWGPWL